MGNNPVLSHRAIPPYPANWLVTPRAVPRSPGQIEWQDPN